jgi:hypothetical protein
MSLSFCAHYYLDNQYHVAGSWLGRFSWFRRKQQLHFIHHRHGNCNFAVIDFFWDQLLGTYRSAEVARLAATILADEAAIAICTSVAKSPAAGRGPAQARGTRPSEGGDGDRGRLSRLTHILSHERGSCG